LPIPVRQEVNQHDRWQLEEQHEQKEVPEGQFEDHVWFEDWWMVASWCDE
jgi:hypothetical protein